MKKNLYHEKDETYLESAHELENETTEAIQSIFDEYVRLGYSIRQISHVMSSAVLQCELMHMFLRKE
jgi:hypothetical protein